LRRYLSRNAPLT
ncbi:hypothetical protein D031_1884B, partial [Vibrio parahaemolyticus VP-48]